MPNPLALILRDSRDGKELPVAKRSDGQVATLDMVGPGRLLHQAYSFVGRGVEKALGQAADKLGLGPAPTSCHIEDAFGNDAVTRLSVLDTIHDSFLNNTSTQNERVCALKKDCTKLLKYALPSESPITRVQTFRSIILLTTRYPGLRRIFLQSPALNNVADSPDAICRFWQSTEYISDREVCFTLEFAAYCLADCDVNTYLESIRPAKLGRSFEGGMGVVDRMLVRYCDGVSGFPRLIAVRYLAGILELPAFWLENYHIQKTTMDKLCKQTLRLIEDINPDSVCVSDFGKLALLDPDGVDALAEAILVGGGKWIQRDPRSDSDYWVINFVKLIKMLRGLIIPDLLPNAFRRAAGNWEACLKGTIDQLPMSNLDYWQYEDVAEFVNGPVDSQSAMPFTSNWRPSDFAEEPLKGNAEGPSSLLKTFTATMRATFRRRTASKEVVTPSDSLTDEGSTRWDYPRPETREVVGGTTTQEEGLPGIPPPNDTDVTGSTNSHALRLQRDDSSPEDKEYAPLPPASSNHTQGVGRRAPTPSIPAYDWDIDPDDGEDEKEERPPSAKMSNPVNVGPSSIPSSPPAIRFDHTGKYAIFMNHSPHRIVWNNNTYPTALHLHEALKFMESRPDLSEKIRACERSEDVYPLSATFRQFERPDWGTVFLPFMKEVTYQKFRQHPDLRTLLLLTGTSRLIYADPDDPFWGMGLGGTGQNQFGKVLVAVRDRLMSESIPV